MNNSQTPGMNATGAAAVKLAGPEAARSAIYDGFRTFLENKVKATGPVEVNWQGEPLRILALETDGRLYVERGGISQAMEVTPQIVLAVLSAFITPGTKLAV